MIVDIKFANNLLETQIKVVEPRKAIEYSLAFLFYIIKKVPNKYKKSGKMFFFSPDIELKLFITVVDVI